MKTNSLLLFGFGRIDVVCRCKKDTKLTSKNIFCAYLQCWMEISFCTFLGGNLSSVLVADDIISFPLFASERLFTIRITDTTGQSVRTW